ncbi:ParB/RepB/Spo0J family partition protein (plasmid) [Limimaricola variabilis]
MSRKHDDIFNDVLNGLDENETREDGAGRAQTRFLKRSTAMSEQVAGGRQEKVLRLVDPASCVMWEGHNRAYELLTPENCADLIEGMKAQGQQEFPAIVRRLRPAGQDDGPEFEVICGARRHFTVSWLRANNYPQFRYLIEERELTDEEAFRLADIENRDRKDISDFERARDYARAIEAYYGGQQKLMAERLKVSTGFLSRFLQLARLDPEIVAAFPSIRDIKEIHARQLRPLMADKAARAAILAEARKIAATKPRQAAPAVLSRLRAVGQMAGEPAPCKPGERVIKHGEGNVRVRRKGGTVSFEFAETLSDNALRMAFESYLRDRKVG